LKIPFYNEKGKPVSGGGENGLLRRGGGSFLGLTLRGVLAVS